MLKGFDMTYPQFVDLCILCGCDYTPTVDGIGPVTAFKLIKTHSTLENVLTHLEQENLREDKKKKFHIPQELRDRYQMARDMFIDPDVFPTESLSFVKGPPKAEEEELVKFPGGGEVVSTSRGSRADSRRSLYPPFSYR